ncbi:MAG: 30S ribosomal protein S17 [Proteobacteria bacterium]|nr:30S ribosomal protein S17 [Desulfobacteraceae bacterium]MBU4056157.1 30S ribosomal protein S17 [Pseudomonadota bacterium]MBU4319139.1 30S ribosomal protein S17 [Pseudomonadota bacterium]MBU4469262.1 30S ribosomal protein S17 [Pseudomonadota bacterium]MCG2752292.1 30S ribosomal protein S17 [Desulfobacteraceae bacterium]
METRGQRKELFGTIVSDRMDKTVVVLVERLVKHPLYHKYIRRRSKFSAHDEANSCKIGDKVRITESRPLSRTKKWRVSEILSKAL